MANSRFITFLLICFLLLHCFIVSAQFSKKDQNDIRKKALKTLTDYQDKINQLGREVRSIDNTRINVENFIKLFASRKTQVYNDLDPDHKLSEFYEAETYASDLALWYPGGITVSLDLENSQVSNIVSQGEDVYSIDFIVDKQINGIYLGNKLNSNVEKLLFRIGFVVTTGQFSGFRIAGVRNAAEKAVPKEQNKEMEIKSAQLTADEERDIDRETRTLLNDYANYLSLIGDTVEDIEEKIMYKESFRSLFANDQSPIYNDILPDNKKSPYIPVSDYINLYSEAYASTGGVVAFQLDSADLGFVVRDREKDYRFTRIVQVNKSFKGNYLGKRKISFQIRLALKISFDYANTVFKNFRIVRIDLNTPKKIEVNEPRTFTDLQKHKAAPKKAEPTAPKTAKETQPPAEALKIHLMLDAGAMTGMGRIGDGNIDQLTMGNAYHVWQTKPNLSYTAFLQYTYMVSQQLGLSVGIGYSSVSTSFSLNSSSYSDSGFKDPRPYKDVNDSIFFRYVQANYDSIVNIKFINIPIGISYSFNISKRLHFCIKPGVNIGLVNKATSETKNGYIRNFGHYSGQKALILQNIDWPELGFGVYYDTVKNKTYDIKPLLSSMAISLNTSAGISLDLSRHTSLALSGYFQYELNDLVKNQSDYKDVFARTATDPLTIQNHVFKHQPTKIFIYGMAIEFILKF